ncbi:MAG TPA: response regulator [Gaiellaceae bacterium]|nr:response regulator [Gaiellaceae bacterium]
MTSAESRGVPFRLILADDDEGARALLRSLFEDGGARVVGEAADGIEAVELTLAHTPDVVLLDVHMPRLDGLQAAERIREAAPQTGILLHTGELTDELAARAGRLGLRLVAKSALGGPLGGAPRPLKRDASFGPGADSYLREPERWGVQGSGLPPLFRCTARTGRRRPRLGLRCALRRSLHDRTRAHLGEDLTRERRRKSTVEPACGRVHCNDPQQWRKTCSRRQTSRLRR